MSASRHNAFLMILLVAAALTSCADDDSTATVDAAVQTDPDAGSGNETPDAAAKPAELDPANDDKSSLPIVFVHGFAGSASQFDSQAQRFVANGYDPERLYAYDHDGAGFAVDAYADGVDKVIDEARAKFKTAQVYLIGHSRGTLVATVYLGVPERAKKVAKVIMIDGSPCLTTIPCDTPNQAGFPGQKHVEVATSAESFKRQYKFLFDKDPAVADIVKQDSPVEISGRAVNFPENTGRAGAELTVYEVNSDTGARVGEPVAKVTLPEDGAFGPITVSPDKNYELALASDNGGFQHFYFQKFLRSTKFIRLLSGPSSSPSRLNINSNPNHAAVTAIRMREWLPSDVLQIKTKSGKGNEDVPNAITAMVSNNPIALYIHDDKATPEKSSLALLPYFPMQPFQTGMDVYMPAAEPTDGTISLISHPRGDATKPQVINVPNWASDNHMIMAMFSDYAQ